MAAPFRDVGQALRNALAHPLAQAIDPDDPAAPSIHRQIIRQKPLLRDVYEEWYDALAAQIGSAHPVLEIGSGAGYLAEYVPGIVTSDVRATPATQVVLDAHQLPFRTGALGAIAMTNVVHHLSDVESFLREAARTVKPGGVLTAIEPWVSPWSEWVYRHLHHEPFEPTATQWGFPAGGPLSAANGALPWILFVRDRERFERQYPEWQVELVRPGWPLRYLLSGGVSLRTLMPSATRGLLRWLDRRLERRADRWAMFALVVLRRREVSH
ncbi:MAG: class I SAM-dependent methyltransferase [Acidobacteriota bacterium]|nr:class I SAM-dependent methyltransferase [Acidobacteriota bacterium]